MLKTLTLLSALVGMSLAQAQETPEQKKVSFVGDGFAITGPSHSTMFKKLTFQHGMIQLNGEKFVIVTSSKYGDIGAVSLNYSETNKRVLFLSSSFSADEVVVANNNPLYSADAYQSCLNAPYNAVAIVYDLTGHEVLDLKGNPIPLDNAIEVTNDGVYVAKGLKKDLFPALVHVDGNAKSSLGFCKLLQQVEVQ